jgi:hypothetical protein
MTLYSSVMNTWPERMHGGWLTEEYIPIYLLVRYNRGIYLIFLGTNEYSGIYSSALYSSVTSSVMKVCSSVTSSVTNVSVFPVVGGNVIYLT